MKLFTLLTAAAGLLFVSACASTAPAPTDERIVIETAQETSSVQPGRVYISADAAKVFTLRDIESEINERGFLAVRVFGKTAELSALKWAFFGDIDYEFCYKFLWFDADGNEVSTDAGFTPRATIPGDPVRFVGHAPTEECRDFALILRMASKADAKDAAVDADDEAEEAAEADAETEREEAAEVAETVAGESYVVPETKKKDQNVSGSDTDVKVIGVTDTGSEE
ncbi:MAG: hypothetical protein PUC15_05075 [Lentisphaeria bacterium]|nr:hypothetical protein [Lentisphaeria bacterium]